MQNIKTFFMIIAILTMMFVGCQNEQIDGGSTDTTPTSVSSGKITSLQVAVDEKNVTSIDLSQSKYSGISDYNATINKSITIKGANKDFGSADLTVDIDGVELSGMKNVKTVTASASLGNGSLKIASSSLSSLNIYGGGSHSIYIEDNSEIDILTVDKILTPESNEFVRLVIDDTVKIDTIIVKRGLLIDTIDDVSADIKNVEFYVSDIPSFIAISPKVTLSKIGKLVDGDVSADQTVKVTFKNDTVSSNALSTYMPKGTKVEDLSADFIISAFEMIASEPLNQTFKAALTEGFTTKITEIFGETFEETKTIEITVNEDNKIDGKEVEIEPSGDSSSSNVSDDSSSNTLWGDDSSSNNPLGDNSSGDDSLGDDSSSNDSSEDIPSEDDSSSNTLGGDDSSSNNLSGDNSSGDDSSSNNSSEDDSSSNATSGDDSSGDDSSIDDSSDSSEIEPVKHQITYHIYDGTSDVTTDFFENETITLISAPARTGYLFNGWFDNVSCNGETLTGWAAGDCTADVELWAKWNGDTVQYTVKYLFQKVSGDEYESLSGYDDLPESGTTDTTTDVTAAVVTGFTALDIEQKKIAADGSTVVNIYYNRNTIRYTFNAAGGKWGENVDSTTDSGRYEAAVTVPVDPARTGYTFSKWDKTVPETFGAENETFIAEWNINHYTVTFKNGEIILSTQDVTYDCTATAPTDPTADGYAFDGWYLNNELYSMNTPVTDNITIMAKFKCVIVFKANLPNENVGTMNYLSVPAGAEVTLTPVGFTSDHWSFIEWNTNPYGTGTSYNDGATLSDPTGDNGVITLYAQWNMKIGEVVYQKTGFVPVLKETTTFEKPEYNSNLTSGVFKYDSSDYPIKMSPYSIGKFEVTQQLYLDIMEDNPSTFNSGDLYSNSSYAETNALLRPVEHVSWYQAIVFCNKLSTLMGKTPCYKLQDKTNPEDASSIPTSIDANWYNATCDLSADGFRLSSLKEWECAARGGDDSLDDWLYSCSGSTSVNSVGWVSSNSGDHTWETGLKAPNRLGIYDMTGNVQELCLDGGYQKYYKGGAYNSSQGYYSIGYSSQISSESKFYGFRICCSDTTE